MKVDSEQFFDSIFLSYNKILERLHILEITTKNGKEILYIFSSLLIDFTFHTCYYQFSTENSYIRGVNL